MDAAVLSDSSSDELSEAIDQLYSLAMAAMARMCTLVAEVDRRQGWAEDGCSSVTPWLAGRLAVSHGTAGQIGRVSRRLDKLPALAKVFAEGRLSWDQVLPASELARPDTDALVADMAPGMTPAALQRAVRFAKPPKAKDDDDRHRHRRVRWRHRDEAGFGTITADLPTSEFATVTKALERVAESAPPDPETGLPEPFEAACADALVELASLRLAADADADRALAVIHLDASVLAGGEGLAEYDDGLPLASETARRLACDCTFQLVVDGSDGITLGIGKRSRRVPAWMMRLLRFRDRHCRYPGCRRTRWVHAHHLRHWGQGGPTDLGNLVLLCSRHHRLVHESGWTLTGSPDGQLEFTRPDGRVLPSRPPGLRPDLQFRLFHPSP